MIVHELVRGSGGGRCPRHLMTRIHASCACFCVLWARVRTDGAIQIRVLLFNVLEALCLGLAASLGVLRAQVRLRAAQTSLSVAPIRWRRAVSERVCNVVCFQDQRIAAVTPETSSCCLWGLKSWRQRTDYGRFVNREVFPFSMCGQCLRFALLPEVELTIPPLGARCVSATAAEFASLTALPRSSATHPQNICAAHCRRCARRTPKLAASPKHNAPSIMELNTGMRATPS